MINVEILGKFYNNSSLVIINRYLALHLKDKVNLRISALDDVDPSQKISQEHLAVLKELENKEFVPDIQLRHSYPPMWHWPTNNNTRVVFIQPWEFTAVPQEWQYKFETFADLLLTPSTFSTNAYLQSGINPERVSTIPVGYNPEIFKPTIAPKNEKTTFLFVGCVQYRKGLDILLKVWTSITNRNMPIKLVIKDTPQVYGKNNLYQDLVRLQYKTRCAEIEYNDSSLSELEMADLYNQSDILVHPYRGEGFGMPVQEAMLCNCVPIVTAGGSTDDFVSEYKIKPQQVLLDMKKHFVIKQEDSATLQGAHRTSLEPDAQHLAQIMQYVVNNLDECKQRIDTSKLITWENMSQKYVEAFDYVLNTFEQPRRVR